MARRSSVPVSPQLLPIPFLRAPRLTSRTPSRREDPGATAAPFSVCRPTPPSRLCRVEAAVSCKAALGRKKTAPDAVRPGRFFLRWGLTNEAAYRVPFGYSSEPHALWCLRLQWPGRGMHLGKPPQLPCGGSISIVRHFHRHLLPARPPFPGRTEVPPTKVGAGPSETPVPGRHGWGRLPTSDLYPTPAGRRMGKAILRHNGII